MNEPLPPELERLMNAERSATNVDPDRARVLRRLESSVAALAIGAAAGTSVAVLAKGTFLTRVWRELFRNKIATALVAVSVGAAGGGAVAYRAGHDAGERAERARTPSISVSAPLPVAMAVPTPTASASVDEPAPTPTVAPTTRVAPTPRASSTAEHDAQLAEEIALVQTARTALVRGDAAGALEATEAHRHRFATGRLVEERESIAIQSLARLGRQDEAKLRADDFARKYPQSVFRPAIARALGPFP